MTPVPKSSGYFDSFDGTRIYYEVRGHGKPLVFVYGIACLMNHWHAQTDSFSKKYRTVMFDFRGHHFSDIPKDKRNLSIDALAADLINLCDLLDIKDAVVFGHSFGTEILLRAYLQRPDLFKGSCLIGGLFSNPFSHLIGAEKLLEAMTYVKRIYNQAPSVMAALWKFGVTNPISVFLSAIVGGFNLEKTAMKDVEIYAQGVANIDIRVFLTFFAELIENDNMDELPLLKIPTLVIAGERDSLTLPEKQRAIADAIPDSELYLIPDGSHCVQLDFPGEVNERIQNFLDRLGH